MVTNTEVSLLTVLNLLSLSKRLLLPFPLFEFPLSHFLRILFPPCPISCRSFSRLVQYPSLIFSSF
jgi:hypothetical protein